MTIPRFQSTNWDYLKYLPCIYDCTKSQEEKAQIWDTNTEYCLIVSNRFSDAILSTRPRAEFWAWTNQINLEETIALAKLEELKNFDDFNYPSYFSSLAPPRSELDATRKIEETGKSVQILKNDDVKRMREKKQKQKQVRKEKEETEKKLKEEEEEEKKKQLQIQQEAETARQEREARLFQDILNTSSDSDFVIPPSPLMD